MRTGNRPAVRRKARNKLAAAAATCALLATAGMAYEGQAFGARVLNLYFPPHRHEHRSRSQQRDR